MSEQPARSIAIVDDDDMILKIFKKRFEKKYTIHPFQSPGEFLETYKKLKIDLFIIDWDMPELDGLQVCQHIRQVSAFDMIPIAFYSGMDPTEENVKAAYDAGAQLFIPKTLSKSFIDLQIDNLIQSSERRLTYLQNQKMMISVLKHNMASKLTGVITGIEIMGMHQIFENNEELKEEIEAVISSSNQIRILFEDLNEILVFGDDEKNRNRTVLTKVSQIVADTKNAINETINSRDIHFIVDNDQSITCNGRAISRVLYYIIKFIDAAVPVRLPISVEISGDRPTMFSLFVEGNFKKVFDQNIRDMNDIRKLSSTEAHFYMHYTQNVLYRHNASFSMIEKQGITGVHFAI